MSEGIYGFNKRFSDNDETLYLKFGMDIERLFHAFNKRADKAIIKSWCFEIGNISPILVKEAVNVAIRGGKHPVLSEFKQILYSKKDSKESEQEFNLLCVKAKQEKEKASLIEQELKDNGFSDDDLLKYIRAYCKHVFGFTEDTLGMFSLELSTFKLVALNDLKDAGMKSARAIEIGRSKLKK